MIYQIKTMAFCYFLDWFAEATATANFYDNDSSAKA